MSDAIQFARPVWGKVLPSFFANKEMLLSSPMEWRAFHRMVVADAGIERASAEARQAYAEFLASQDKAHKARYNEIKSKLPALAPAAAWGA